MSNSDAVTLENLKLARDALITVLTSSKGANSYSVDGRSVSRADLTGQIDDLQKLIDRYESRVAQVDGIGITHADVQNWPV